MNDQMGMQKYVAFLRGINVGGHHKVPMADLRTEFAKLGYTNVVTILNSGNIIFEAELDNLQNPEEVISGHLESHFGFSIPTIVRKADMILEVLEANPFKDIEPSKDIRFYISFLKRDTALNFKFPWISEDQSYKMIEKKGKNILSVLDLSISKTPKAMEALEKQFGSEITTRNWNTILRIAKKINAH